MIDEQLVETTGAAETATTVTRPVPVDDRPETAFDFELWWFLMTRPML